MPSRRSKSAASFGALAFFALPGLAGRENESAAAARAAFEKVESSFLIPNAADVHACVGAQLEAGKHAARPERGFLSARQRYCEFLEAALYGNPAALSKAALDLISASGNGGKDFAPLLQVLGAIASPKASGGPGPAQDLATALASLNCIDSGFVKTPLCNAIDNAAQLWIGWLALGRGEYVQAEAAFRHAGGSPWNTWLAGRYNLRARKWREAAIAFGDAAVTWPIREKSLEEWLGPRLAPGELPSNLAYAQAMSGDLNAARQNLDAALAARPNDSRSLFLRARITGSVSDLEAAANSAEPGEAHFYKAVLAERRKEFPAAFREFDAAAKEGPDAMALNDIAAWKSLAGAASGECPADPDAAERIVAAASPLFPREEYARRILECRLRATASLAALQALDRSARPLFFESREFPSLSAQFATEYLRLGLQAEERKDGGDAAMAYRRALEWSPQNTKARFNLGALYIGEEKFDSAEAEYRALLQADPLDREAQFWLGQSILAAKPSGARKAEACALLQQSIRIQDSRKRDEFATAISTSACGN